jgi:hypothetical protein
VLKSSIFFCGNVFKNDNIDSWSLCLFIQGEPITNPSQGVVLSAEVFRDDIKVEGATVSESSDGQTVCVIFNARCVASPSEPD